jgi:hypothetical protein
VKINEMEDKRTMQRVNNTKIWFFLKDKLDGQTLVKLSLKKIRGEKGDITRENIEI